MSENLDTKINEVKSILLENPNSVVEVNNLSKLEANSYESCFENVLGYVFKKTFYKDEPGNKFYVRVHISRRNQNA